MGRREDEERNSSVRLSGALLCYWHRAIAGARVGIRHRSSPVELPLFTEKDIKVNNQLQGGRAKIAPKSPATWSRCFTLHHAARDDSQKPHCRPSFGKQGQVWFHLP